jgi:hypothetical protein
LYLICDLRRDQLVGHQHDICLQAGNSEERELAVVPHRSADVSVWASALRQRFQDRPVVVCLKLANGPLIYALQKYDFLVLLPLHPVTLAKCREVFAPNRSGGLSPE